MVVIPLLKNRAMLLRDCSGYSLLDNLDGNASVEVVNNRDSAMTTASFKEDGEFSPERVYCISEESLYCRSGVETLRILDGNIIILMSDSLDVACHLQVNIDKFKQEHDHPSVQTEAESGTRKRRCSFTAPFVCHPLNVLRKTKRGYSIGQKRSFCYRRMD